ncbi:MAG: pyridoxal-phosphate dependent enzyme, partial [Myxococcota bacterium]
MELDHPVLRSPAAEVSFPDPELGRDIQSLTEVLTEFRHAKGFGRAISAPQIGLPKRLICFHLGAQPFAVLNPHVTWRSEETFDVWDDCLSVPDALVRVRRHRSISLEYDDPAGRRRVWRELPPDLSELLQHEMDHLDGVLMTERAVDAESMRPISERDALLTHRPPEHRLSLTAIAEAADVIDPVFRSSPQYECESLSRALGCTLTVKVESLNPIRSFKGRGVDYYLEKASQRGKVPAMVCASAGNFGQAMAYVGRRRGVPVTVFAAESANPLKVGQMRAFGAKVELVGADFDAAKAAARERAEQSGSLMVEDGALPEISEGAGSIAVELLAGDEAYDAVLVPLGNGALLTGIARWFKAASPSTRVVGVCSSGADAMARSWRAGVPVEGEHVATIADGIAVRVPVPAAVEDMKGLVDDVLLVSDEELGTAMQLLFREAGLLIEPAGAAGVAALVGDHSFR